MMNRTHKWIWLFVIAGIAAAGVSRARAQADQTPASQKAIVPIKVEFVIARFQGEKRVSSLPFSLFVNANEYRGPVRPESLVSTNLRMGLDVPITTTKTEQGMTTTQITYRHVGTNIDCSAEELPNGQFRLYFSIQDSAIYTGAAGVKPEPAPGLATIRSFQTTNRVTVPPGKPVQFTTATDMITGEVVKVDVMVTPVK
jgi:heme/copper-type cytochrome/quinol oxidase subunit 2